MSTNVAEGKYPLDLTATDKADNISAASGSFQITTGGGSNGGSGKNKPTGK